MSNKTLEKELLNAVPDAPKSVQEYENLDDFLVKYCDVGARKQASTAYLGSRETTARNMNRSWDGIPWLLGTLYRSIVEGHHPLILMGMTQEQESEFYRAMERVHSAIGSYVSGSGTAKPNTKTKVLYDQIISNGF